MIDEKTVPLRPKNHLQPYTIIKIVLKKINSALISVYHKDGLDAIIHDLHRLGVTIYSTGGTQTFIEELGVPVKPVEGITGYPSILDGRVKTLHPGVFGGILARREENHLGQLAQYNIPEIDLVIVDLYPFEETVATTTDENAIIEKIDIGGISLIRAGAKNHNDVVIVPSKADYAFLANILKNNNGESTLAERKHLARRAFAVSSHYDTAIFNWFSRDVEEDAFSKHITGSKTLRYGENPHQGGKFYGQLEDLFTILGGKELSYNNLVDVDAAVNLMAEFKNAAPTFAILKHTNSCGVATRPTLLDAWKAALAGDPTSAFGGVFICNTSVDRATAEEINQLFYEVIIAPAYEEGVAEYLLSKKGRIVLIIKNFDTQKTIFKNILNGVIEQDADSKTETVEDFKFVTEKQPTADEISDLLFAIKCTKHLKSNAIALVKNQQLIGMNCGQTSRVDALRNALAKAAEFGFDVKGAVMASEAFFPFADCVEIAYSAGITAVAQPGGSIKDADSIASANKNGLAMVLTGVRHFKH